jgi:uncharacterized membrane protein YvbJ
VIYYFILGELTMNQCPQCGQQRQADEYRCLACGCFYSQLDEILATEEAEQHRLSFKGRVKAIMQADNFWQALKEELHAIKENTPRQTIFTLWVIFAFVFALIVSVL